MEDTVDLHPSDAILQTYFLGTLDDDSKRRVVEHLKSCRECLERASGLSSDDTWSATFLVRHKEFRPSEGPGLESTLPYRPEEEGATPIAGRKDLMPPGLVNHPDYQILKELGRGGMGVVYLAHNRLMGRDEVLKVIGRGIIDSPGVMDRFLREIRAVAKLRHPNIVTAYTAFRNGESLVFAMEYVEGLDLARMVKARGPMPVAHACQFIQQAALGLEHAREHGMVHRDIKPGNLMLSRNRDRALIKILDFGLARASHENTLADLEMGGGEDTRGSSFDLTVTGQMLGTPGYIAPEQIAASRSADIRADIYSLGCTLYYLLSGRPPFEAPTIYEILRAHNLKTARPLNLVRSEVPSDLANLVVRMMAKEPDQRFQTPAEVAQALTPFFKRISSKAAAPGSGDSREEARTTGHSMTVSDQVAAASAATPLAGRDPNRPEELWKSLINFDESEDIPPTPVVETRPVRNRPRWFWPAAGLVGFAAVLLCAGVIHRTATNRGVLVIETEDPSTEVLVKQLGNQIAIIDPVTKTQVELRPGNYELELSPRDHGAALRLSTDSITLSRGDRAVVSVRRTPPPPLTPTPVPRSTETGAEKTDQSPPADPVLARIEKAPIDRGKEAPPQVAVPAAADPIVWKGWSKDDPPPALAPFDAAQARANQDAWAKHLGVPVEYENSVGMKFILIPPGEFLMGSTPAEIEEALKAAGDDESLRARIKSESPQHKVILTQAIYLAAYEVTQKDYQATMGKNPSYHSRTGPDAKFARKVATQDTSNHPVERVSWNDATEFCIRLSQRENRVPLYSQAGATVIRQEGTGYRLPTEAEWEYACRAGTTTKFWSGDGDEDLGQVGWSRTNSGSRTHTVGKLKRNPFGLFDTHGNVSEWVEDWWEPTYYGELGEKPAIDPEGPSSPGSERVIRGGDGNQAASSSRSSRRDDAAPTTQRKEIGFRVVLVVDAVKETLNRNPTPAAVASAGRSGSTTRAPRPAIAPFNALQARASQHAWARYLGLPVEYSNSIHMRFILIPPGEFTMGSTTAEIEDAFKVVGDQETWARCLRSEVPRHKVILTQPIYLGIHEVRQKDYEAVMGENPSCFARTGPDPKHVAKVAGLDTTNFPVDNVSWNDAAEFCARLSEKETLKPFYFRTGKTVSRREGTGYRLPTEAEWEFACRAGTTTRYWSGDRDEDLIQAGWFVTNSGLRMHAVGELNSNPFGLFDIHGNAFEWVEDWWEPTYYGQFTEKPAINPSGPSSSTSVRINRGGNFGNYAVNNRSSTRYTHTTSRHWFIYGFRVSLSMDAVKQAIAAQGTPTSGRSNGPATK